MIASNHLSAPSDMVHDIVWHAWPKLLTSSSLIRLGLPAEESYRSKATLAERRETVCKLEISLQWNAGSSDGLISADQENHRMKSSPSTVG